MARVTKNPEERRNELIDTAIELFTTIGYEKTSVSDIVKKISVAQGTFYYYFKSKEDIFLAIFERHLSKSIDEFNKIINQNDINALEKFKKVVEADLVLNRSEDKVFECIHREENASIHQKVIINTIKSYKPLISNIIKQGVKDGIFKTDYPEEVAEIFLVSINFLFDPGIFSWKTEEYIRKVEAISSVMEKTLQLPRGSFNIVKCFKSYIAGTLQCF